MCIFSLPPKSAIKILHCYVELYLKLPNSLYLNCLIIYIFEKCCEKYNRFMLFCNLDKNLDFSIFYLCFFPIVNKFLVFCLLLTRLLSQLIVKAKCLHSTDKSFLEKISIMSMICDDIFFKTELSICG